MSTRLDGTSVKIRESLADRFIYVVWAAFAACITIIAVGAVVKLFGLDEKTQFGEQFLMTSEHTIATYLSAAQFILAGITGLLLIRPIEAKHRIAFSALCLGLIFIGLDDALVIHERLGQSLGRELLNLFGVSIHNSYIRPWMVVYIPLLFFGIAVVLYLLPVFRNSRSASWAAVGGCAFFGLGFFMEILEPALAHSNVLHAMQVGIEESSELLGAWSFMYAFVLLANSYMPGKETQ